MARIRPHVTYTKRFRISRAVVAVIATLHSFETTENPTQEPLRLSEKQEVDLDNGVQAISQIILPLVSGWDRFRFRDADLTHLIQGHWRITLSGVNAGGASGVKPSFDRGAGTTYSCIVDW